MSEELRRMLGYTTRYQLVYDYTIFDFDREEETLSRLGF
jgi:hypothetical protein